MTLREIREKLAARRKTLSDVFAESRSTSDDGRVEYDFRKVKSLDVGDIDDAGKPVAVAEKIQAMTREIDELALQEEKLAVAEKAGEADAARRADIKRLPHSDGGTSRTSEIKTFGQIARRAVESPVFKNWLAGSMEGKIEIDASYIDTKAVFSSLTGFPPEATRTGDLVTTPLRPLQITDIMPTGRTSQNSVVWMAQTTRTQAAAETAEGVAGPEAAFVFAEQSTPVREIVVTLPVTEIQLEDAPNIESEIQIMLREDMAERLDSQILNGTGVAPNLRGLINTVGILTQAKGTDPVPDAIFKAGTVIRTGVARAVPTHVLLTPANWQALRLLRDANGAYVLGPPGDVAPARIWGWPVIENEGLAAGTGLIGGFSGRNIVLVERRGIVLTRGFVNDDFAKRQQTLLVSMRVALQVKRPAAFATITGL